jgi:hypothetical protein
MKYKSGRPKGFVSWKPQEATQIIMKQVQEVLSQYKAHWPLTIRQIFYRLVALYWYDKTEKAYDRLLDYMNRARRSKMVPMEAIRDDGTTRTDGSGWIDQAHFIRLVLRDARGYQRNKQYRQKIRVLVLVEAAGMVPQIVKAVGLYGVPVLSSSGFDSLTMKYELAMDIVEDGRPTVVLHIGDLDPSGVCIFDSIRADVEAFVDNDQTLAFQRIALLPEHITRYGLATAPAKSTDRRGNGVVETCQCEALPPDTLAEIVKCAVLKNFDQEQFQLDQLEEIRERQHLVDQLQGVENHYFVDGNM